MTKKIRNLFIAMVGVFVSLLIVRYLNTHVLPASPLPLRMVLLIAVQWILLIAPLIMIKLDKTSAASLGFSRQHLLQQIGVGLAVALGMSLLLTVIPILCGFKESVGSTQYAKPWQFLYEFIYGILGVSLAEEIVFRGYLFHALTQINHSKIFAMAVSSIVFGLFHLHGGNFIQVVMTAIIGLMLCLCRNRIRYCTLLSLIIAHGTYDALITLLVKLL